MDDAPLHGILEENLVSLPTDSILVEQAFGSHEHGVQHLSMLEACYLMKRGRLSVKQDDKTLSIEELRAYALRGDPAFNTRLAVYSDLRSRGYVVKTALKFGADFRVYDRGIKPGEDHARWVVYPVPEGQQLTWHEFAAKNRVAHSTKKRLMIGIVDDEGDVTYYEIRWTRP